MYYLEKYFTISRYFKCYPDDEIKKIEKNNPNMNFEPSL